MRALKIDPKAKAITEIELPANVADDFTPVYAVMGCQTVDVVNLGSRVEMLVDDEGLLKPWCDQSFFRVGHQTLAGVALVFGVSPNGDLRDCPRTAHEMLPYVSWVEPEQVRVPAPTFSYERPDGTTETKTLDPLGRTVWDFNNQPF